MSQSQSTHWLDKYANNYHTWQQGTIDGRQVYKRRLGLVETSFDTDGVDYGGRADVNALLTLETCNKLSTEDLRKRIILVWASLRLQHVLLMAKMHRSGGLEEDQFVVDIYQEPQEVIEAAGRSVVFVDDHYNEVDSKELYRHCLNTGRLVDPSIALSKLFVLPLEPAPNGNFQLRLLIIAGHQITDGLSMYFWMSHLIRTINMPLADLERDIVFFKSEENIASRLPPAQEDLYPPISGNRARQRWFWAIMRILRHVKRTLPRTFVNPLRRNHRLPEPMSFCPIYSKIFDYAPEQRPPMNSFQITASLSRASSQRLIQLVREANVSIGAGCFALVGLAMMEIEEFRHPNVPSSDRRPFGASFPLNPRLFFGYTGPSDSCMLAFSDGIVLPFLSSDLPVEKRLKLAARQANRQLRVYQKRLKSNDVNTSLDAHSPGRLLANGYIGQIERVEGKLLPHKKTGLNPQGAYPANTSQFGATNGVSSVGSTAAFFKPGTYDLSDVRDGKDFVADYRSLRMGVRARDNEFLVGASTNFDGTVGFGSSYDGNAISEEAAQTWKEKMESLLEPNQKAKL